MRVWPSAISRRGIFANLSLKAVAVAHAVHGPDDEGGFIFLQFLSFAREGQGSLGPPVQALHLQVGHIQRSTHPLNGHLLLN